MIDSEFCDRVVGSWSKALSQIEYSTKDNPWSDIQRVLNSLADSGVDRWPLSDFDAILESLCGKKAEETKELFGKKFLHLLVYENDLVRFTSDAERKNESFVSGIRIANQMRNGVRSKKYLANNYCLAFPARMAMLGCFLLPGEAKSVLKKLHHHFLFHKKVNPVVCDFFVKDAKWLGMLDECTYGLRMAQLPDNVLAYLTAVCYLRVSNHKIDIGVPAKDVEEQLSYFVSSGHFSGPWRDRFSPSDTPVFQSEMDNSQVRFLPEGFNWMVSCGLIDPIDIAKTLKVYDARRQIKKIGNGLKERIDKHKTASESVNLKDFLAYFNC